MVLYDRIFLELSKLVTKAMLESTKDLNKVIMAVGRNVAKIEGLS